MVQGNVIKWGVHKLILHFVIYVSFLSDKFDLIIFCFQCQEMLVALQDLVTTETLQFTDVMSPLDGSMHSAWVFVLKQWFQ